jgi:hypothetical protein
MIRAHAAISTAPGCGPYRSKAKVPEESGLGLSTSPICQILPSDAVDRLNPPPRAGLDRGRSALLLSLTDCGTAVFRG